MSDNQHGHAFAGQRLNDLQHFAYQLGIQRRGRFVKQHDVRLQRQRPGDRHALLLAAGELSGVLVGMGQQADAVEQRQGLLAGDRLVQQLVIARGQHHVVEHRAVGEQVEALEDHADAPYPGAHLAFVDDGSALKIVLAVENDLPAIKAFEGVDGADQGGFAGAGRADDADHLPVLHLQIDAFQHLMLPPGFANAPQIERRRRAVDGRGVALFAQRRQALAQRLAFRLAEGLRTLTLNIETIFQRPEQPGEDGNHHHVVHRYRQQGLHHKEILRIQALAGEQQLG